MDNNIQPDKVIHTKTTRAKTPKTESTSRSSSARESLEVGRLLKNTLSNLSQKGLDSINTVRAMVSLKESFPSEHSQLQIQARQAQIDNPIISSIRYTPVSDTTQNSWFNGQVIHAKVLEVSSNGRATLLIDKQTIEVKPENLNQVKLKTGQNIALIVDKISINEMSFILSSTPEQSAKLIQLIQNMVSKQQGMSPLLASLDSVTPYINANKIQAVDNNKPVPVDTAKPHLQVVSQEAIQVKTESNSHSVTQVQTKEKIPASVAKAIEQLINKFSSAQDLSLAAGLKQAVKNSGLFLENKLQFKTSNTINLDSLSIVINSNKQAQNIPPPENILSKSIDKIQLFSQHLSSQIDSKLTISSDSVQRLDKSLNVSKESTLALKAEQAMITRNELITVLKEVLKKVSPDINLQTEKLKIEKPQTDLVQTRIPQNTSTEHIKVLQQNIKLLENTLSSHQVKLTNEQVTQLAHNLQNTIKANQDISVPSPVLAKLNTTSLSVKDLTTVLDQIKVQLTATSQDKESKITKYKLIAQVLDNVSKEIVASDNKNISPAIIKELKKAIEPTLKSISSRLELIKQIIENKLPAENILSFIQNKRPANLQVQVKSEQDKQLAHNQLLQSIAKQFTKLIPSAPALTNNSQQQISQLIQQPPSLSNITEILSLLNRPSNSSMQLSPLTMQNITQLLQSIIDKNTTPLPTSQLTHPQTNLKQILSELKSVSQTIENQLKALSNSYPKIFTQSINQLLEQINQQFIDNNKTILNNKIPSFVQSQAKQFSEQLQQITQIITQSMASSRDNSTSNPQINNDLRLNIQRLMTLLQNVSQSERLPTVLNTKNPTASSSSLLQSLLSQESELNRQALPTRHKHAQVVAAQQNQLLQLTNPSIFQQNLITQLESVMSRMVATQAATQLTVREQGDPNVNLAMELPFKFQDKSQILQLKFTSEDKKEEKSKGKIWTANLAFELQSLGAIRIYISLDNKDIAMQFWTEKPSTQKIFTENFHSLQERLKLAGYHINQITAIIGIPEEAKEERKQSKKGLIDEKV